MDEPCENEPVYTEEQKIKRRYKACLQKCEEDWECDITYHPDDIPMDHDFLTLAANYCTVAHLNEHKDLSVKKEAM